MKYSKKKTNPEKTPWLTCSKCGSRRVQQKSKEKVRCLDCGHIERFYVKQLYVYEKGDKN